MYISQTCMSRNPGLPLVMGGANYKGKWEKEEAELTVEHKSIIPASQDGTRYSQTIFFHFHYHGEMSLQ